MTETSFDKAFGQTLQQTGALSAEQINHATSVQARQIAQGSPCSLADVLMEQGLITPSMRENVERKLRVQQEGGIPQLGPYRLVRRLGQGAMGAVYLAEDTMLARQVALKVLPKAKCENRDFVARFKREATTAGKLNHVNIAGAYAVDEDRGYHYYAMEFCDGEPLDASLKNSGRLPEKRVLELGIQVAKGLQFAHEHGIIHRDIKPANIILTKDGVVKVLDLGLSKDLASNEGFQTMSGIAMGTPHYISPEQARGAKDIDGRTDIYSLGATLYHLATGTTPFTGTSAAVIMTKHLTDQLPDPRDVNPELSDGMVQILTRAMAKAPKDRYRSMAELLADMELVRDDQDPASSDGLELIPSSIALRAVSPPLSNRRTTGPNEPVPADGGDAPRLRRTTGPQEAVRRTGRQQPIGGWRTTGPREAVRITGRQQPIEGQRTTGVREVIDVRAPSGRLDPAPTAPRSNRQKFLMGAGAGVVLVLLIGLLMAFRGKKAEQTAASEPQEPISTIPGRAIPNPQQPVAPPVLSAPSTPTVPQQPTVPPVTATSAPTTEETAYDPKAMVAQSRLAEAKAFAAKYPQDPWSCAEMLKDLTSAYAGTKAAEEAQAFLKSLTFEGERPAAHRNWHLEWENISGSGGKAIGSLTASMDGRPWVLSTHPPAEGSPLVFQRKLQVPAGKPILLFQVHGHENGDFDLQVQVDGNPTARQLVGGKTWRTFSLDLTRLAGREALIRVLHIPTGWSNEHGYWQAPSFVANVPQDAAPLAWAAEIVPDSTKPVFLSNLEATEVKVGFGQFGKAGYLGFEGGRIVVDGVPSPNGLSTHPASNGAAHVAYPLGKRFGGFRAKVALNDTAGANGCESPLTFVVIGDGRPLWTSQPISRPKQPQSVEVGLEDVEKLELVVRCSGMYYHAHAVWLEPQLLPKVVAQSSSDQTGGKPAVTSVQTPQTPAKVPEEPVTKPVGVAQGVPETASPFTGFKEDLAKAELAGAELLKDSRPFRLQTKSGKALAVGEDSRNRVIEVKNGALQIEELMGGGKVVVPVSLATLDARTRYELAILGLPPGPLSELKLAYAGLLMLQSNEGEITPQQIAKRLDAAAKDPAQTALVAQIREQLQSPTAELPALKAWQRAETFFERRSMREAKTAYDAFQKDFGQTKTAASKVEVLKQRYEAIERALGPARELALDLGAGVRMDFVLVPAGEFQMGSTGKKPNYEWAANEAPAHKVTISKPFYIGKYPVTVAQFTKFVDATNYQTACEKIGNRAWPLLKDGKWAGGTGNWRNPGFPQTPDHPVVLVTWNDAQAFAAWVRKQLGKEVRLPTEAQWEYAARGPASLEYPFGNQWDGRRVNHKDAALQNAGCLDTCSKDNDGYAFTSPVGRINNASWCGAFDMAGNVWQWVQDWEADYTAEAQIDPQGPANGQHRIFRGGDWKDDATNCRSAFRGHQSQGFLGTHLGFRVVIAPGVQ